MTIAAATGNGASNFDWLTVVVSLVVGIGGGVIAALITAANQRRLAQSEAQGRAAKLLWDFHRTLHDYALEWEAHELRDGTTMLTKTQGADVAMARAAAYPYRSLLAKDKMHLVARAWVSDPGPGGDPMAISDEVWKWARELEVELLRVFGDGGKLSPQAKPAK